ncbi:DUF4185 domain-containing protein [Gordonia aichiensis]|nr:DUF4185 domain-containing protein [Gordonia aichiensis]
MLRHRSAACRLLVAGMVAVSTSALLVSGGGHAAAAPCANAGNGSLPDLGSASGSLGGTGSLGTGSLGTGSAGSSGSSGTRPGLGTQGPLPVYLTPRARTVAWVTGPRSINRTFSRYSISGTDLGISWDNGSGQTLMAFGDTFGDCNAPGQQWRHNTLLRTRDTTLGNGVSVPPGVPGDVESGSPVDAGRPTYARELIPALGFSPVEVTTIPTAAISLPWGSGHRQFINFMSVRSWGSAGHWVTNYSGIAYSDDNGQTWTAPQSTFLVNSPVSVALPFGLPAADPNNGKFQQNAYVRGHGAQSDYVYQFGTPNGRFGAGFLSRFAPRDILERGKYQYWAGRQLGWVDDIARVPDDGSAIVVPAPVTELSVAWSPYLNKYMMLDGDNGIRIRTADRPEGPWSAPTYLVEKGTVVLYGPMIQPQSPAVVGSTPELFFNASRWSDYNVMLIRADLSRIPH